MIERELIESVIYNYIDKITNTNPKPQPSELVVKLNDYIKTYLRIKAEAKFIQTGDEIKYFVSYKDTNKNSNTIYFTV